MVAGMWLAAGFLPPPLPSASAGEIAAIYQNNMNGIRMGSVMVMLTGAFYLPFSVLIFVYMRRMEPRQAPVLSYTQLVGGVAGMMLFVVAAVLWTLAAFRPDRSPEITQALNDFGWLFFLMPSALPFLQNAALGLAIIGDKNSPPIMPRWVGFYSLWSGLIFLPGALSTFFKTGPFAWNGLLALWIPATVFGIWIVVTMVYLIEAINSADNYPRTE